MKGPMFTPPPNTKSERELEHLQKKMTEAELVRQRSRERRDALALEMWAAGMNQNELAARLDRADRAAGGNGVEPGAVQKTLFRLRKKQEGQT
jgi:hypothetical protein